MGASEIVDVLTASHHGFTPLMGMLAAVVVLSALLFRTWVQRITPTS